MGNPMKGIWVRMVLCCFLLSIAISSSGQERITLQGGGTMYYEVYGTGTPVLLIHGHSLDRRMWAGQIDILKDKYQVIVPDMRGYGLSSDPEEGYQFTYLDDIMDLLDSLHIDKLHVVGLSMGAYVAGDFLGMHPERLLSCMMLGGEPCKFFGPSHPRSEKEKAQRRAMIAKARKDVNGFKQKHLDELLSECYEDNVERIKPDITKEVMEWRAWQALHVPGRVYYGLDAFRQLKKCKPDIPTLIIYGTKETTKQAEALQYLPNGKQLFFEECGHMVNLEQPERLNLTLLQWLEEHTLNL